VAEVGTGEEAIEALIELEPALVLVAADMPGLDGHETRRRLLASRPRTVVILLSGEEKAALSPRVLQNLWDAHGKQVGSP